MKSSSTDEITDEQKQGLIDTITEFLSDSPDLFKNQSDSLMEIDQTSLSFESAKKELEEWFKRESQLRYLSHRDILEHMKKLYPGRKDILTTTWVQNFCRHRPHMSGNRPYFRKAFSRTLGIDPQLFDSLEWNHSPIDRKLFLFLES